MDWVRFATAWRGGYEPAMGRVRRGEVGLTPREGRMIRHSYRQDHQGYVNIVRIVLLLLFCVHRRIISTRCAAAAKNLS